jgi:hypothetical protein
MRVDLAIPVLALAFLAIVFAIRRRRRRPGCPRCE